MRRILGIAVVGIALAVALPATSGMGAGVAHSVAAQPAKSPPRKITGQVLGLNRPLASGETYLPGAGADWVPIAPTATPVTVDEALDIVKKFQFFASQDSLPPIPTLANYSNFAQGETQADGTIKLFFTNVTAWVVLLPNTTVQHYGHVTKEDVANEPASMDAYVVVDATTGKVLSGFQTPYIQRG